MPALRSLVRTSDKRKALSRHDGLGISCCQTFPAIIGNGPVYDRSAVDALPGVKNEEEV